MTKRRYPRPTTAGPLLHPAAEALLEAVARAQATDSGDAVDSPEDEEDELDPPPPPVSPILRAQCRDEPDKNTLIANVSFFSRFFLFPYFHVRLIWLIDVLPFWQDSLDWTGLMNGSVVSALDTPGGNRSQIIMASLGCQGRVGSLNA